MKYMMLLYENGDAFERGRASAPDGDYWEPWMAYVQALQASGLVVGGNGLMGPETATTLRLQDGRRHVQDGPFAAAKEQLGGFFIIDVPDLETALDWAARCPAAASGGVELRPVRTMGDG